MQAEVGGRGADHLPAQTGGTNTMAVDFKVPQVRPDLDLDREPGGSPESAASAGPVAPVAAVAPLTGVTPVAAPPVADPAAGVPGWSLARRIAFRFVFCYLVLYNFPRLLFAVPIPGLSTWLFIGYSKLCDTAVAWTGAHVLHLSREIESLRGKTGSGDTTYDYVKILCFAAFAAIVALVWTLTARRTREHPRLHEGLRIFVRYSLGPILIGYGMAKVIKTQFPFPSQDRLMEPIGETSPMGLLWTFMGVSTPYTFFAGAMEVLGGALLFFRRTTTLGALVTIAVMTNVVMLNLCYDVPVKQYSIHLLAMAVFLLLPDLRRLADVLVLNRTAEPANLAPPWSARWARIAGLALSVLFLGFLLFTEAQGNLEYARELSPGGAKTPIYGTFEVEAFSRNGQALPPLLTEASRWRRLTVSYAQFLSVRWMDDTLHRFRSEYAPAKHSVTLSSAEPRKGEPAEHEHGAFTYAFPDKDHLVLQGTLDKDALVVKLRRMDPTKLLLVSRGFRWIAEFPFNR
jgi:uncharacterized membrane protein YphA (DoxX/SURF4 family)